MKDSVKLILSLLPIIVLIILFFISPIVITFQRSMEDMYGASVGFDRYVRLFSNPKFVDAFWYTLEMAVAATVISAALAIMIAMALRETFIGKRITVFLIQTNISIPHIAMATMVIMLISQTGIISAVAYHLGFIETWSDFPRLVYGPSSFGTIFSYSLKFVPFICISVLSILQSFSRDYEDQSATLGVGRLRTFFFITLPAIRSSVYTTSMIVFCFAFGSYDVPMLLGRTNTLSMMAYSSYYSLSNLDGRYDGYAISIVIAVITLTITAIYLYMSFSPKREGKG